MCIRDRIKVLKEMTSPFIVRFIDFMYTQRNIYLVTEFCNGGDLFDYMYKMGKLSEDIAIRFLRQFCEGYKLLFQNGIVHRDLKPPNILLHDGIIRIADFGFSKVCSDFMGQICTTYLGTPMYMSPQIMQRTTYSNKCDVWSLGVMLYQMILGILPWQGKNDAALLQDIAAKGLRFPPLAPVSHGMKDLINRCLQYEEINRISWPEIFEHPILTGLAPSPAPQPAFAITPNIVTTPSDNFTYTYGTGNQAHTTKQIVRQSLEKQYHSPPEVVASPQIQRPQTPTRPITPTRIIERPLTPTRRQIIYEPTPPPPSYNQPPQIQAYAQVQAPTTTTYATRDRSPVRTIIHEVERSPLRRYATEVAPVTAANNWATPVRGNDPFLNQYAYADPVDQPPYRVPTNTYIGGPPVHMSPEVIVLLIPLKSQLYHRKRIL
eukprot:TRINITY_DN11807_c0_g1_i2.p1 TRINITY_DN11807_c0_g1~~TRINITY_DN11807_c0_g1_i2.p1  ORF type:complete len:433 (+),score=10.15 TRINITY_DN11807_c0_g1_i2:64-1362(+)